MPAVALVCAGVPGHTDVPVDVVPLDACLTKVEFLAEGVRTSHTLLQEGVAGPDVSEEGHAVRLRFIRTGRNTEMTLSGHAEQSGVSASESDEEMVPGEDHKRRRRKCWPRNAQAMPGRLWRSWKDRPADSRCAMEATSSLPRRRHLARYFSETATGVPQLFSSRPTAPTAWVNVGRRHSNHRTQGQKKIRIK